MAQNVYDDNYVDTVSVIDDAKMNGLDMRQVSRRMNEALDADELFGWHEWVYAEIRKVDKYFVSTGTIRKRLMCLSAWTPELQKDMDEAVGKGGRALKRWEKKALRVLENAKKRARELYG